MKRLHVHVGVADLEQSIGFYSTLQVYDRLKAADRPVLEEGATTCCYSKSEKSWVSDPDGVVWEAFHTNAEATVYGESPALSALSDNAAASCCAPALPAVQEKPDEACCDETTSQGVCCAPKAHLPADAPCCA